MSQLELLIRRYLNEQASRAPDSSDVEDRVLRDVTGPSDAPRSKHANSGWLASLAAAVTVSLIVAGMVFFFKDTPASERSVSPAGPEVKLSTGKWRPGDPQMEMGIEGRLALASNGCIHLKGLDGALIDVLWPADYTARRDGATVELIDAKGQVAAEVGQNILTGGGELRDSEQLTCRTPGAAYALQVHGDVTAVK